MPNATETRSAAWLRKALVVFQFAVTVSVLTSSLLVTAQIRYIASQPLGFTKDNRLVLHVKGADNIAGIPSFINRLNELPQVEGVTFTALDPAVGSFSGNWNVENNQGMLEPRFLSFQDVDSNYLDVMDMELTAGRFFTPSDDQRVVVNEALVRQMGWENPIGKRSGWPGDREGAEIVVGVVKDFHHAGLQSGIGPLILRQSKPEMYGARNPQVRYDQSARITVAMNGGTVDEILLQARAL